MHVVRRPRQASAMFSYLDQIVQMAMSLSDRDCARCGLHGRCPIHPASGPGDTLYSDTDTLDLKSVSHTYAGLVVTEHHFRAPLDYASPHGPMVDIFARAVVSADKVSANQPWLVYLEGGPGFEGPRPYGRSAPAWLDRALEDYRVIFLDQRGMGRSSRVGVCDAIKWAPRVLANRLSHFGASAVIRDAERLRDALGIPAWSVLGQSYGGFCTVAYQSAFPGSLTEAFITGGLPTLDRPIDDVYRKTYAMVIEKTQNHYARFPEDRARVLELIDRAAVACWIVSSNWPAIRFEDPAHFSLFRTIVGHSTPDRSLQIWCDHLAFRAGSVRRQPGDASRLT